MSAGFATEADVDKHYSAALQYDLKPRHKQNDIFTAVTSTHTYLQRVPVLTCNKWSHRLQCDA